MSKLCSQGKCSKKGRCSKSGRCTFLKQEFAEVRNDFPEVILGKQARGRYVLSGLKNRSDLNGLEVIVEGPASKTRLKVSHRPYVNLTTWENKVLSVKPQNLSPAEWLLPVDVEVFLLNKFREISGRDQYNAHIPDDPNQTQKVYFDKDELLKGKLDYDGLYALTKEGNPSFSDELADACVKYVLEDLNEQNVSFRKILQLYDQAFEENPKKFWTELQNLGYMMLELGSWFEFVREDSVWMGYVDDLEYSAGPSGPSGLHIFTFIVDEDSPLRCTVGEIVLSEQLIRESKNTNMHFIGNLRYLSTLHTDAKISDFHPCILDRLVELGLDPKASLKSELLDEGIEVAQAGVLACMIHGEANGIRKWLSQASEPNKDNKTLVDLEDELKIKFEETPTLFDIYLEIPQARSDLFKGIEADWMEGFRAFLDFGADVQKHQQKEFNSKTVKKYIKSMKEYVAKSTLKNV